MTGRMAIGYLILLLMLALFAGQVRARGLIGETYVAAQLGAVRVGAEAISEFDQYAIGLGIVFNGQLATNFDIKLGYSTSRVKGERKEPPESAGEVSMKKSDYSIDLAVRFLPESDVEPFARFGIVHVNPYSGDSLTFLMLAGGIEISTSAAFAITPHVAYLRSDSGDPSEPVVNDFRVAADASYWLTDRLFATASAGFSSDSKDIGLHGGLGLGF